MIQRIIDFCARNRAVVFVGTAFAVLASWYAIRHIPLDAIPDLSDAQVIIYSEWMGRSPDLVEDQVTYPVVTSLLATPGVSAVRGYSMFGMSFVYVIFEEGTDIYWARSRVLEYMKQIEGKLPQGVTPRLGPDASSVGWVFQYALVDSSNQHDLSELRTFQDFTLRYALASVPGVAEVASIGGYQKQYQVEVDPNKLRAYNLSVSDVIKAIRSSNNDVGGRMVELTEREYYIRGRGYIQDLDAIRKISLTATPTGTPVLLGSIANVTYGPDIRRGVGELDGIGEAVGATVVMRYNENALDVIARVKQKLEELKPSFPAGVDYQIVYDRSKLIDHSIETLNHALIEEGIVVALVILIFLLSFGSSLVPILTLPVAVGLSFVPMYLFGVNANIMSLGGIAIAIGAMVDAAIVLVENAHKRLEKAPPNANRTDIIIAAAKEVGPSIFYSLLIITIAFLPIFALNGQGGRLFKPLAYTKTFAMFFGALTAITVAPALMTTFLRGKVRHETDHPISKFIIKLYKPFVFVALRNPKTTVAIGVMAIISALPMIPKIGSEFMPPLNEGDILYMPTTMPNISIEAAKQYLQVQDRVIKSFPEVVSVYGKAGRMETATDPAPLSMFETVVQLKPRDEWRKVEEKRWYSSWLPNGIKAPFRWVWPEERTMTWQELTAKFDSALQMPGWTNAWTMPIKTRIDMLSTGIRTPIGVKIFGSDLDEIERIGMQLEKSLSKLPATRSVFSDRNTGGFYIDITPNRDALARYGLTLMDINDMIETAVGGTPIEMTVEGRNRFTINVRYPRDMRSDVEKIRQVLITLPGNKGAVPLSQVAEVKITGGPSMIRDENGMLVGYVYIDIDQNQRDIGGYVAEAKQVAQTEIQLPSGYYLKWTGQYELLEQMTQRMKVVIPITLLIVIILLYLNFRNFTETLIVLASVPFALVGSIWLMYFLGYHYSTATLVGIIALVGLATQTGIVMILYLDHAYERRKQAGKIRDLNDIIWAHMEGTVMRVRPKLMTVSTMLIGLVPLLWATGSGADVMKRIAAPMVGGLLSSAFLTLEIIPVVYTYWRLWQIKQEKKKA